MNYRGLDVKKIRKNLRLNQKEFGELLGVSAKTISEWENEERPISKVKHLTKLKELKNKGDKVKKIKSFDLLSFMNKHRLNQEDMKEICGLPQSTVSEIINDKKFIKIEYIAKIRDKYPDVDNFIIYYTDNEKPKPKTDSYNKNDPNYMRELLNQKDETIEGLKEAVSSLKMLNNSLVMRINELERDNFFSTKPLPEKDEENRDKKAR